MWGTICFVGIGTEVRFYVQRFLFSQITILTSSTMSVLGQRECQDFIVDSNLNIDRLFANEWKLEDATAAYREFGKQASGKGVFIT